MKVLDKILVVIFNICLLLVAIWVSAVPIAKNKAYYEAQFEKNQIYSYVSEDGETVQRRFRYIGGTRGSSTYFTDEQLDIIIEHIIDYLFKGKESFNLEIDNVLIDGEYVDDVQVFGEVAVTHMHDVKILFTIYRIVSAISLVLMIGILGYFLYRLKDVKKTLLNVTLIFYGVIFLLVGIFLLTVYIHMKKENLPMNMAWFTDTLWRDIHYLLFMFQPEKVEGSFFNDILTEVLTLELFITAVVIVVVVLVLFLAAWLCFAVMMRKHGDKLAIKFEKRLNRKKSEDQINK